MPMRNYEVQKSIRLLIIFWNPVLRFQDGNYSSLEKCFEVRADWWCHLHFVLAAWSLCAKKNVPCNSCTKFLINLLYRRMLFSSKPPSMKG